MFLRSQLLPNYFFRGNFFFYFQSAGLMEEFTALARDNTERDLETCGVLGASLVSLFLR